MRHPFSRLAPSGAAGDRSLVRYTFSVNGPIYSIARAAEWGVSKSTIQAQLGRSDTHARLKSKLNELLGLQNRGTTEAVSFSLGSSSGDVGSRGSAGHAIQFTLIEGTRPSTQTELNGLINGAIRQVFGSSLDFLGPSLTITPTARAGVQAPTTSLTPAQITRFQQLLTRAGFDTRGADGKIGANTRTATSAFQRRVGLPASGELDVATQQALNQFEAVGTLPAPPPPVVAPPVAPVVAPPPVRPPPPGPLAPPPALPAPPPGPLAPPPAPPGPGVSLGSMTGSLGGIPSLGGMRPQTVAAIGAGVVVVGLALAYATGGLAGSAGPVASIPPSRRRGK